MPPPADLHDRVAAIAADTLRISREDVTPDLGYGGIAQWDSVGHLDLLVALEAAFGFSLTTELIPRLTTIRAIEDYLAAESAR